MRFRRPVAVRNSSLHNSDLNAESRVIEQFDIIHCAIGQAQLHADMRPRKDFLILLTDRFVGLIFSTRGDGKFCLDL
jgi:hypothetical protein